MAATPQAETLRDTQLEACVIADVLSHSAGGLGRYDEAGIRTSSFSNHLYQLIWETASALDEDGEPINALTVSVRPAPTNPATPSAIFPTVILSA